MALAPQRKMPVDLTINRHFLITQLKTIYTASSEGVFSWLQGVEQSAC